MISSFRYYMKKKILHVYIDLTVVPYWCKLNTCSRMNTEYRSHDGISIESKNKLISYLCMRLWQHTVSSWKIHVPHTSNEQIALLLSPYGK